MRSNGRTSEQLRPLNLTVNTNKYAEGSVLIEVGDTKGDLYSYSRGTCTSPL